jgi:pimeloyl-ACP methyl ester carboxylesterase
VRLRVLVITLAGVALGACSSSSKPAAPASTTTVGTTKPSASVPSTPDPQVWLCKPGLASNPCRSDLTATAVSTDGTTTVERSEPADDPPVDCFYVYPTVSNQPTPNANLQIDPAETGVAIAQAARFSPVCDVYAPMYRQITVYGLVQPDKANREMPYADVVKAWKDYLARYNDGRGVVLIGHSQGAFILKQLIADEIEKNESERERIVSAILLGANVTVADGNDVGGDFERMPACRADDQVGCVIAFSTFDHSPPATSLFGRTRSEGQHVLCTNPAALGGGPAPLDAYFPARRLEGPINFTLMPLAPTPWVRYPDLLTGECTTENGATWLQVDDERSEPDDRLVLRESLGPTWGFHIYDGNVALGNLVDVVRSQAAVYGSKS